MVISSVHVMNQIHDVDQNKTMLNDVVAGNQTHLFPTPDYYDSIIML